MKLGYAWKWGPFELIDKLGPKWFAEKLKAAGKPVPALLAKVGDGTFYRITNGALELSPEHVVALCDRHRGIGGDGLIRAVPSRLLPEG